MVEETYKKMRDEYEVSRGEVIIFGRTRFKVTPVYPSCIPRVTGTCDGQILQLFVDGVDEPLLVPVLLVHDGEDVALLRLLQLVQEREGGLGLDSHVLGSSAAVIREVGAPVPSAEKVQNLSQVGETEQ